MGEITRPYFAEDQSTVLLELLQYLTDPITSPETKLEHAIGSISSALDLPLGFIAAIDETEEQYQIVFPESLPDLTTGTIYPLDTTYCRKTIQEPTGQLSFTDALGSGWEDDPAYREFGLESYVGVVIDGEDELYGTLCFADENPREDAFDHFELTLVQCLNHWTRSHLQQGIPLLPSEQGASAMDHRDPDFLNDVLDILQNPIRRSVIATLLETPEEAAVDTIVERVDGADTIVMSLVHQHLPKMEEYGIVKWDRQTGMIHPGASFGLTSHIHSSIQPFDRVDN